jgi:hypothetical protein
VKQGRGERVYILGRVLNGAVLLLMRPLSTYVRGNPTGSKQGACSPAAARLFFSLNSFLPFFDVLHAYTRLAGR